MTCIFMKILKMWLTTLSKPTIIHNMRPRFLSTTQSQFLNQKWRKERKLPMNPNSCGVLTDGPDYTFLDGRPTPYGARQKERILKQHQITDKIIKLTAEVDFAVDRHRHLQEQEQQRRTQILDSKLKAKGIKLLQKK